MEEVKKHLTDIQDICRHGWEAQRHREKHAEARLLYLATGSLMHHLNASSDGVVLDTPDSGLKGDQLFAYVFQQAYSMGLTTNADMEITCSTAIKSWLLSWMCCRQELTSREIMHCKVRGMRQTASRLARDLDEESDSASGTVLSSSSRRISSSSRGRSSNPGSSNERQSQTMNQPSSLADSALAMVHMLPVPEEHSETPVALPMRVPLGPAAHFSANATLLQVRRKMLNLMAKPNELEQYFQSQTLILQAEGEAIFELFSIMKTSWVCQARRRVLPGPVVSDCLDELEDKATRSPHACVRILADVYSGWYSEKCLSAAQRLEDFEHLAGRFSRCWGLFPVAPNVDPVIWAEMIQFLLTFLAFAVSANAEAAIRMLPMSFLRLSQSGVGCAKQTILEFAHNLWKDALTIFEKYSCWHDAFAMTATMVLLAGAGNEISKVYVKQLYRLTDQMSEEIRSVFKVRANLIREDLSVLGSVNPGLIDLSSITAGP